MEKQFVGLGVTTYLGFLLMVLGSLTWITGLQFLLPSLGPSAFALATKDDHEFNVPRRVIGAQVIAAVTTFLTVTLIIGGRTLTTVPPLSLLGLLQILTTFLAVGVTTITMYVTRLQHPPAYATVLIISLGLLTTVDHLVLFIVGVVLLVGTHETAKRVGPWELPYDSWR